MAWEHLTREERQIRIDEAGKTLASEIETVLPEWAAHNIAHGVFSLVDEMVMGAVEEYHRTMTAPCD